MLILYSFLHILIVTGFLLCESHINALRARPPPTATSLRDVVHQENKLYLVFEYLDQDLKKYMDFVKTRLHKMLIKVRVCV